MGGVSSRKMADLVDQFIPYAIWRSCPEPVMVARARTLVAVLGFSVIVPVLALIFFMVMHLVTGKDFLPAMLSLGGVIVILVIEQLFFHASANLQTAGIAFSVTFFVVITAATALTGGAASPVMVLLFCTPLVVFLISGWQVAEYAVFVSFTTGLVFMLLAQMGANMPNIMHQENLVYARAVVWFFACMILVLLFYTQKWLDGLEQEAAVRQNAAADPDSQ